MPRTRREKNQEESKKRKGYYIRLEEKQIEYYTEMSMDKEVPIAYLLRYSLDLVMSNHQSFKEYALIRMKNEKRFQERFNRINNYTPDEDDY
jgi:hypothetical protein